MTDSPPSAAPCGELIPKDRMPLVSVVIPVLNDAQRLACCLDSLARQNYPGDRYEVIVVDNGSTDQSRQVAEEYGAQVLCFPTLRVGALRNRGVERAGGEILAFVDSDHEIPSGWIGSAVQELQSDSELAMVGSPCLSPPHGTWVQRHWELHRIRNRNRRQTSWLGAGNMFVRKTTFDRLGGFNEELVAAEDVDLCVRLAKVNGKIVSEMRVANIHHGEPTSLWHFFRKEYWRGSSGLRAFLAHGMPLHELPSLIYPAYHLAAVLLLAATVAYAIAKGATWAPVCGLGILLLPSALLALKTSWQTRHLTSLLPLGFLYFTYGLARAAALFKR